jgi:hypothetical protein
MEAATSSRPATRLGAVEDILTMLDRDREELVTVAVAAIVRELPAYAASPDAALEIEIGRQVSEHIDAFTLCARSGRAPDPDELPFIGMTVERRIDQGIPAEQILGAYRIGHHVLWAIIEEASLRAGAGEGVVAELALAMMRYIEAAWSEVARSYIRAERRVAADLDRGQSRLVEALLAGRGTSESVRLASGGFPVAHTQEYLLIVVSAFPDHASAALRTAVRRLHDIRGVSASVAHVREDDLIAVAALELTDATPAGEAIVEELRGAARKLGCDPALGVGLPAVGPAQVPDAYREARAAAHAAGPGHTLLLPRMTLVDRLTVMLETGAEPARLVPPRVREFIAEDNAKNGQLVATLREYVSCDQNARRAAEALFVHRNTVLYRLQRVAELSGLNPHVLGELLDLIAAARLLGRAG